MAVSRSIGPQTHSRHDEGATHPHFFYPKNAKHGAAASFFDIYCLSCYYEHISSVLHATRSAFRSLGVYGTRNVLRNLHS